MPIIFAIVNAAHKNNNDLPLEVFSLPVSFPCEFSGAREFADIYIQDLSIKRKATHTDVSPNFPVIDLIFNYDLSKLRIQVYSFNDVDDVAENDQFIYVGWIEAFLLAILKETGEIVATDWANPCSIVSYIAKNQGAFLDVLVELEKFSQKLVFGFITEKEENEINKYIQSVAGGSKYNPIN